MTDLAGRSRVHSVPLVAEPDGRVPHLAASVTHDGDGAVVCVTGELDLATAPSFLRQALALLALPLESVTLDLAGVGFIDSSGLGALIEIRGAADDHRIALTLRAVPGQARRVLELTNLADQFDIEA
jgi:anti-anti-sigma factor